jgi:predicted Fe-S protein YdhL (DUF1289 family)
MNLKPESIHADETSNPCIRHCCLDQHDVCLGCFRRYDEILAWHSMTDREKIKTKAQAIERQLTKNSIVGTFNKPD